MLCSTISGLVPPNLCLGAHFGFLRFARLRSELRACLWPGFFPSPLALSSAASFCILRCSSRLRRSSGVSPLISAGPRRRLRFFPVAVVAEAASLDVSFVAPLTSSVDSFNILSASALTCSRQPSPSLSNCLDSFRRCFELRVVMSCLLIL